MKSNTETSLVPRHRIFLRAPCGLVEKWVLDTFTRKTGTYNLIERLHGVWPKIIPVAMEMPIFSVNFSSLNYPNLNDENLGPYG